MPRVIITGDDFGLSEDINQAIILAHQEGILTSASLLVNGLASEHALALAKKFPNLSVGLHLALVQSRATLPHKEIPGLVDTQGNFSNNPVAAGFKYYFMRYLRPQLEKEIQAQIEKYLATGLVLSHLSGHLNLHVHPRIFPLVLQLITRYGIKGFRLPGEPLLLNLSLDRGHLCYKLLHFIIFHRLAKNCYPALKERGVFFPQRVFGLLQSGDMNEAYLTGLLTSISYETVEIYFHLSNKQHWHHNPSFKPKKELEALLSPRSMSLIKEQGIELITYRDLENQS